MESQMLFGVILVALFATVNSSPNARQIASLHLGRISNDVIEDALLDTPDLIRKYGYPVEIYEVETEDGYVLQLHRIPHGRDAHNNPNEPKTAVFLQHGIFSSSADWINMGPGCALGYLLAEQGYDVWLGNTRGNYYSRRHKSLNPDSWWNGAFWEFSWDEIGYYDLPAMIDMALEISNQTQIQYIGHSQGTTAFFVMTSMRPEYNRKIISMHAMAPVAFMTNVPSLFLRFIAPFANSIESISSLFGIYEFFPNTNVLTWAGQKYCMDELKSQSLCANILFLLGGRSEGQLNSTMIPVILGHTPAGSASRQLVHYGQSVNHGNFRRYNHGWFSNLRKYGSGRAPKYALDKITTPIFLHYASSDHLAHPDDVDQLAKKIPSVVGKFRVTLDSFSHVDFMWGMGAKALVWDRILNLMRAMEDNNE